jgi:transcriptional regulator with XRE-family HTH domain
MDWDLEAPGLHRYFAPLIAKESGSSDTVEKEFGSQQGVVDLFTLVEQKIRPLSNQGQIVGSEEITSILKEINIRTFTMQARGQPLDVMIAGALDSEYAQRVRRLQWEVLLLRAPTLMTCLLEWLSDFYDVILIDSRTGVTDVGGICTALLPDKLVAVFTPNRQSLLGTADQVRQALRYRAASDDLRPLRVFPLPSRVDAAEPELRNMWRIGRGSQITGYQPQFERLFGEMYGLEECQLNSYFDEVQIQYVPRFSYGEDIPVLSETGSDRLSLSRSYEAFFGYLEGRTAIWAQSEGSAGVRLRRARERLGLKFRDVEQASQLIAERHNNPEFVLLISRLSDIENQGTLPSLYRLYSLCSIYSLSMTEALSWYGIRLADLERDIALLYPGPKRRST